MSLLDCRRAAGAQRPALVRRQAHELADRLVRRRLMSRHHSTTPTCQQAAHSSSPTTCGQHAQTCGANAIDPQQRTKIVEPKPWLTAVGHDVQAVSPADHSDALDLRRVERQQTIRVLQQHRRVLPVRHDAAGTLGRMQPRCQRYRGGGSYESWRAMVFRATEVVLTNCALLLTGRSKMPTANIGSSWR